MSSRIPRTYLAYDTYYSVLEHIYNTQDLPCSIYEVVQAQNHYSGTREGNATQIDAGTKGKYENIDRRITEEEK